MNKKLLTLGVASAALAAMPVAGVFAEAIPATSTDTITITVPESCELGVTNDIQSQDYKETMNAGAVKTDIEGSKFKVACNTGSGWEVKAVGAGTTTKNALESAGDGEDIVSSATPKTNLSKASGSADQSDWGFKAEAGGATSIESGFEDWHQIPATEVKIASGSAVAGTDTFNITYGVSISGTQKADTYIGKVTYTLSQPAA